MPRRNTPPLPMPPRGVGLPQSPPVPIAQRSFLEIFRPGRVVAAQLPTGGANNLACPWWNDPKALVRPVAMGLPLEWEDPYHNQLLRWRDRSRHYLGSTEMSHGMIAGQTWLLHLPIPEGEVPPEDKPQPRSSLILLCMPPLVILREGDLVGCSDPRSLNRAPNASKMPRRVITVCRDPYLLEDHELESIAWAAQEDRRALVGEILPERPPQQPAQGEQKPSSEKRTPRS